MSCYRHGEHGGTTLTEHGGTTLTARYIILLACCRTKVAELNGIDIGLRVLALYKKADPGSDEEAEMIENLFDVLCSCIMVEG